MNSCVYKAQTHMGMTYSCTSLDFEVFSTGTDRPGLAVLAIYDDILMLKS